MHTLITHIRPHLDDICALWLFKRYLPDARDAALDFVPIANKPIENADPGVVYVGVGRGEFDEHKGDIGQCSTSLVFADLANRVPLDPMERNALEKLVDWVLQEDMGKLATVPYRQCTVPAMLEAFYDTNGKDSRKSTEFGFALLDVIIVSQRNEALRERDWATRTEFESRFGRAAAVASDVRQIDNYAYSQGFPLVVVVNTAGTYQSIRAQAGSEIDLAPIYEKLKAADPGASWYLHHSGQMLICGGDHTKGATPSALTMKQLIAMLK